MNQSIRTLRVHVHPGLTSEGQFQTMKEKIHKLIPKLMNMKTNACQASVHHNVCLIKTVFFGYSVINITKAQEEELKKMHEKPILIGLSRNYPRKVLCMRKSTLRIGLMEPRTIIDVLKFKTCIRCKLRIGNSGECTTAHEEFQEIKADGRIMLGEDLERRHCTST